MGLHCLPSFSLSYRNGVPVRPDGSNILLSSDGSLILNYARPSDEGTYTCNAYTGIYSVSATAEVRVIKDSQPGEDDDLFLSTLLQL